MSDDAESKIKDLLELLPESVREEIKEFVENRDIEPLIDYVCRKFRIPREAFESLVSGLEHQLARDINKVDDFISEAKRLLRKRKWVAWWL